MPSTKPAPEKTPPETHEKTTALRPEHRRTGRGTAKCAELRAVAAELFLAHGYDGVSLDEIVRAAGGSKTNVYAFYGGKEGLFLAAVEARCRRLQERLGARDLAGLGLEQGLRALGRDLVALLLEPEHLALYRLVIGGTARFPGLGAVWYENGPLASRGVIAAFVAGHAGELAQGTRPDDIARAFHDVAVMDLLHRALLGEDVVGEAQRERAVEMAVRLVLGS
ncbi:TetR/AcrR family transcriptional regulator [Starkeya sp. ORNL1]|uniref:TetR/AcrR family transcriptional regulator n=1 Tax=Starkeya sp. ORNL1 TaxID=2709380 RepID=UPI0014638163|nr:TetR/AcrR family transcriptional regulator [Starkeya sp. ORNL1]QJP13946.1 TetR/AcrR family transcriptional regulator [Starkeya sp. ORNL1]